MSLFEDYDYLLLYRAKYLTAAYNLTLKYLI